MQVMENQKVEILWKKAELKKETNKQTNKEKELSTLQSKPEITNCQRKLG